MTWLPQVVSALIAIETGQSVESAKGQVESGDGGKAHGLLQIHQGVIDDVNRVCEVHFTLSDAQKPNRAQLICLLYLTHWTNRARMKINRHNAAMVKVGLPTNEISNAELAARIWNGGPDGWRRAATADYGQRVLNLIATEGTPATNAKTSEPIPKKGNP